MKLFFVTTNENKVREARDILSGYEIEQVSLACPEIRADSAREVAIDAAKYALSQVKKPCFVEDAGLFIGALGGFPGTYSAYVFKRLGNEGILRLMQGKRDRSAKFISAVAYVEPASEPVCFEGIVSGKISDRMKGSGGFGYDPIVVPEGIGKTFAELPNKNELSHRCLALTKMREYLDAKSKD